MKLEIELTPDHAARLNAAAEQSRMHPADYVKKLIDLLPPPPDDGWHDEPLYAREGERTLADAFAGRMGGLSSGKPEEKFSENIAEKFTEYVIEKHRRSRP